ncbi:MAG: acylase [Thermoanaerobaculia bacterium]|nr:acylase [Thermoanaerobaculia bacterium]
MRLILVAATLLSLTTAACTPSPQPNRNQPTTPGPGTADILWDQWGIPHIFAGSDEALFYASGWAQARAHGDLVLRLYGTSRGRAAEYWGEQHVESDRWVWTVGIPGRAQEWWAAQSEEATRQLDAFVAGFNAYAEAHPERIDDEVEVVLPVVPTDVLAQTQRSIHFTFMANPRLAKSVADRWLTARSGRGASFPDAQEPEVLAGSNAWAVSPSRSASGHAMLLANPHLPWTDLFTWFEIQLTGPTIDAYGASLVGSPFLGIAFNDHLGWTHTVNTLDATDIFELELADGGVDAGYVFDGEVRVFDRSAVTLQIRSADGSLRTEELLVRSSVHGPVFAVDDRVRGGGALALRVAGLDQPGILDQYMAMCRAKDLEEFEAAVSRLQMPMFTIMYADRKGHVMHLFGGRIPVRPQDTHYPWDAIVPGNTSATLWTEVYPYEQLPRVVDPESGWLQNANDPPWTTTIPRAIDPADHPRYMAPRFMHFRAQQSAQLLADALADGGTIDFEDFEDAKHSTEMEWAVRILDDLELAVAAHGDEQARAAMDVLSAWDRRADAESRGAVLFEHFVRQFGRESGEMHATPWNANDPLLTPDGLADPVGAANALSSAASEVETSYGRLDVPWGEVYRLQVGDHDHPASGGPGSLGVFRVLGFAPSGEADGRQRAVVGDSFVSIVEFSDPVRARALLSYGNHSQPGSPYKGDQLELMSRQELRPVWRHRADVEALTLETETLSWPD